MIRKLKKIFEKLKNYFKIKKNIEILLNVKFNIF